MFARVSTYQGETDQLVEGFRRTLTAEKAALR
jgi:hypothetical protein